MFCYTTVVAKATERLLLAVQMEQGTGIFGCNDYSLFSDEEMELGIGPQGPVIGTAIPGDQAWLAPVEGTSEAVWHNTQVFIRAWKRMRDDGVYRRHTWTVKVDPDTVFLPGVLQQKLGEHPWYRPQDPMYLLNCERWKSLQGPLEIASGPATERFLGTLDRCEKELDWQRWGEDWFVDQCMRMAGVGPWDGYDLLDDMWCNSMYGWTGHTYLDEYHQNGPTCNDGKPAFHPYKTPAEFMLCLNQALR